MHVLLPLQTKGFMEQVLVDKMMDLMKQREQDKQPFLIYYAPFAIHIHSTCVQCTSFSMPQS
jgi:hypothetical protein